MLTDEQRYVLSLLQKSFGLRTESAAVPEDTQQLLRCIQKNGILLTVFQSLPPALQEPLRTRYYAAVRQAVLQSCEGERVLQALSEAGLDCIALKGWELRKLYPNTTMRQMADLDILVKPYEYSRICAAMEKLGYRGEGESSWKHDSFRKGEVHIEMHKRLTDDSGAIQAWERELWSRAERVEGRVYRMAPEDFAVFHFVHLHKDFMNGSLGLRRIADTWLLSRQPTDTEQVKRRLETFGMGRFYERMLHLARASLGEEEADPGAELLLAHAFTYGIYGSDRSYKAGRIAAMGGSLRSGKLRSAIAAVFLPYSRMKAQFPILQKHPLLLPYCWLKRIVRFLRGDRKRSRVRLDYTGIREEDYREMKRFFEAGGV